MRNVCALLALALLAACGQSDNDPGPGGITVGEARALDEAAEMIESRRPPAPEASAPVPSPAPTNSPSSNAAP